MYELLFYEIYLCSIACRQIFLKTIAISWAINFVLNLIACNIAKALYQHSLCDVCVCV